MSGNQTYKDHAWRLNVYGALNLAENHFDDGQKKPMDYEGFCNEFEGLSDTWHHFLYQVYKIGLEECWK